MLRRGGSTLAEAWVCGSECRGFGKCAACGGFTPLDTESATVRILFAVARFLFAGARILIAVARILVAGARILFAVVRILVAGARILSAVVRMLVAGARILSARARILNGVASILLPGLNLGLLVPYFRFLVLYFVISVVFSPFFVCRFFVLRGLVPNKTGRTFVLPVSSRKFRAPSSISF